MRLLEELVDAFRDAKRLVRHWQSIRRISCVIFPAMRRRPAPGIGDVGGIRAGDHHVAVLFEKNDHFLQKFRANFLADAIDVMLQVKRAQCEERRQLAD